MPLNQRRQPMPGVRFAAHRASLARHGCAMRWVNGTIMPICESGFSFAKAHLERRRIEL